MNSYPQISESLSGAATTTPSFGDVIRLSPASRSRTIGLTIAATLGAFLVPAVLCAFSGVASLKSFLTDFGAQSRFFIVIPLLILGEPLLIMRLNRVAAHFQHEHLVEAREDATFEAAFSRFTRLRSSVASQVVIVVVLYAAVIAALRAYSGSGLLLAWMRDTPWIQNLSAAGLWYFYISLPVIGFFLLRAAWCQILWALFMRRVTRLDLHLIPSHPDHAGGIGFIETCLRGYYPFALAIGTILAGGVANHVVHGRSSFASFEYMPFLAVLIVLLICVAPLCIFADLLWRTRDQGILAYGGLVSGVGREFEKKWVSPESSIDQTALAATDFSATTDLYSIAANISQIRLLPFGLGEVSQLLFACLLPAVPVALISLPLHVVFEQILKLFF